MSGVTFQVTFDAGNPQGLAGFWAEVLGYVEQPRPDGFGSWDAFLDSDPEGNEFCLQ